MKINLTPKEIKAFEEYVFRLERFADEEGYNKKYNETVSKVFQKLRSLI